MILALLSITGISYGACDSAGVDCNCPSEWQVMPPCVRVTFSDVNVCEGHTGAPDGEYILPRGYCLYKSTYIDPCDPDHTLNIEWRAWHPWSIQPELLGGDGHSSYLAVYDQEPTNDNNYLSGWMYFYDMIDNNDCTLSFSNMSHEEPDEGWYWYCDRDVTGYGHNGWFRAEGGTAEIEPLWDCTDCDCNSLDSEISPYKGTIYYGNDDCCPGGQGEMTKVVMTGSGADWMTPQYTIQLPDPCDPNNPDAWIDVDPNDVNDVNLVTVTMYPDGCRDGDGYSDLTATFTIQANQGRKPARARVKCEAVYYKESPEEFGYEVAIINVNAQENDCCSGSGGGGGCSSGSCGSGSGSGACGSGGGSGPGYMPVGSVGVGAASMTIHAGTDPNSQASSATLYDYGDRDIDVAVLVPGYTQSYILSRPLGFMPGWHADINDSNTVTVTGPDNLHYVYEQDDDFMLSVIEEPNGTDVVTFTYNGKMVDKQYDSASDDDYYIEYIYTGEQPKLTTLKEVWGPDQGDNTQYDLTYDPNTGTVATFSSDCSDCAMGAAYYEYGDNGMVSKVKDANDLDTVLYEYEYDAHDRVTAVYRGPATDANYVCTHVYTPYGDSGRYIADTYTYTDENTYRVTRSQRDSAGNVTKKIQYAAENEADLDDPVGDTFTEHTFYYHDANGAMAKKVVIPPSGDSENPDPDSGLRRVYVYDPNMGKLLTQTWYDVNDVNFTVITNTYEYTPDGNDVRLISSIDARDANTGYTYSGNDLVPQYRTMPTVSLADGNDAQLRYEYEYDSLNRLICEKELDHLDGDAIVARTEYFYDVWGNLITQNRYNDTTDVNEPTQYFYNYFNDPNRTILPSGVASGRDYYDSGKLSSEFVIANDVSETEPNIVSRTKYFYDNNGRLRSTARAKDDDGEFEFDSPDSWVWTTYEHDVWGNKTKVIEDANDLALETTYEYNFLGEQTKVTLPTGKWTQTVRNTRGLTYMTIVGYDVTTEATTYYYYDKDGNLEYEIAPDLTMTHYEYDDYDRVIRISRGL